MRGILPLLEKLNNSKYWQWNGTQEQKKTNNLKKPKLAFPKDFRQNNKSAGNTHKKYKSIPDEYRGQNPQQKLANQIKKYIRVNNFITSFLEDRL